MEIRTRPLAGSPLVQDYLAGLPSALRFYPAGAPGDLDAYRRKAAEVSGRFRRADRERLAALLEGGGPSGAERLSAFVEREGYAVTTGQQPGLFGGPLFTLYKGLTAVALAARLEEALERPVLPVYWVASEDHDWEEVRRVSVLDRENELHAVEVSVPEGQSEAPLHRVPFGNELARARRELLERLPTSDFSPRWSALLEEAYREGATLPSAFARLLEGLLGPFGVFVLSPESPAIQAAAGPLLLREAEHADGVAEAIAARGADLRDAGYSLQVPLLEGGVNLFLEGPRGRDRLFRAGPGSFRLRRAGLEVTLDELRQRVEADPAVLSPNVLLRPVVESALVPTLAYVAGPGETAYFAQTAPLFQAHRVGPPVVHPRLSAVIVEAKVAKVLGKFALDVEVLARPHHELAGEILREDMPAAIVQALAGLREAVARGGARLGEAVETVDPTLGGPVEHLRSQTFQALDDVERKVVQALKRENEIALAQLRKASTNLFPGGRPQERVLSPFQYLFRYGDDLLERWRAAAAEGLLVPAAVGAE